MDKQKADLILEDREKRYEVIINLIERYSLPVVCGKINCPGEDKNTFWADKAYSILEKEVEDAFREYAVDISYLQGYDGRSVVLAVNMKGEEAKYKAVSIEETHPLGRIFDIDIYGFDGIPLSRTDIGIKSRTCILCGGDARNCSKIGRHGMEEIIDSVNKIIKEYSER